MAEHDQHDDDDPPDDQDRKYRSPSTLYADFEPSSAGLGPNGELVGVVGEPIQLPAADPRTFVCLRGPCRYYWEMETFVAAGNPADTWGKDGLVDEHGEPLEAPRAVMRTCLVHPGTETDLHDELVYRCNRWDPVDPRELKKTQKRRSKLLRILGITE